MARSSILDPTTIAVVGTDRHLPSLPLERMTLASLRRRFSTPEAWQAELTGDGFVAQHLAAASVLVPLVQRDNGLQVLLTRRTDHLRDHAGQISFPGGRVEPEDTDAAAAALREAEEEVGLGSQHVEVIGSLPVYTTVTNYVVTPVVGLVLPPFELRLDPFEVAEAFEVPLAFLMNPSHHRRHQIEMDGHTRQFLSMPWHATGADGVRRDYFIWGATAAMLRNLYAFLSA